MPSDGRELLPLTWWGRALRWLKAMPLWGWATLGAAILFGAQKLRIDHLTAKQARDQRRADLAGIKLARETARTRDREAAGRQVQLDRDLAAAEADEGTGADKAREGHDRLKAVEKRWPTR